MMRFRLLLFLALFFSTIFSACDGDDSSDTGSFGLKENPGRVMLHRLNRAEYNNTVRDLLGTELRPADDFPEDDFGYGFDNIASVLTVSPLLVDLYAQSAERLVAEALQENLADPLTWHVEAEVAQTTTGGSFGGVGWNLWSNGELYQIIDVPMEGTYRISARVFGQQAGPELVKASLLVDGIAQESFSVAAMSVDAMEVIEVESNLTTGLRQISVSFDNDYYEPEQGLDRNLVVDWLRVEGPLDLQMSENETREKLLDCGEDPVESDPCARTILANFATKAYRRPLVAGELESLMSLVALAQSMDDTWEQGVALALETILTSPHFMYRVEYDPNPRSSQIGLISGYELASRLSYFIWSTMPDEELFRAAQNGTLHDPAVLDQQVARMLRSPRAEALIENFAGQWLYIRAIDDAAPDVWYYPDFDEELRAAMALEMGHLVRSIFFDNRSLLDLLNAEHGWVNGRLASHYGIPDIVGEDFQEVLLTPYERGGMLTQSGWLMARSYPTRTSPVKRGKWILEQLLCSAPSAPPPGVEGLEAQGGEFSTIREQLEAHRQEPLCASCHDAMDPLGFGLEHFDGIGAFREMDGDVPVNAADVLPDDSAFNGALELQSLLATDPRVPRCIARKLFVYGLGRGVKSTDRFYLEAIETAFVASGYRLQALIQAIVKSDAFTMRHGEDS